jgi:protein-serine/threonine kinase
LDLDLQDEEIADIQKEIELLSQLKLGDAPNMTMFYGTYMLQHKLWIIMDYCSGGSLRTLVGDMSMGLDPIGWMLIARGR